MTFGGHIRMAGAVVTIIGVVTHSSVTNLVGLMIMAIGALFQIDYLEKRVEALEPKEDINEEN